MKVHIFSQDACLRYQPDAQGKTVLIRVKDPNDDFPLHPHQDRFSDTLHLAFHDLTQDDADRMFPIQVNLFQDFHAQALLTFFQTHQDADTFVIHCHAGVSRSAAVGICLARFLRQPDFESHILTCGNYLPNPTVVDRFTSVLTQLPLYQSMDFSPLTLPDIPDHVEIKW
ncbi:hypothetical protein ACFYKX_11490 [Cytobacillus sp. FJAT-54145]|uniref:Tyrosine specific protein phosphatases domain-containing protein n=1 Tax=Cytobacillus spartinae TaxID=3299023 RepID=A0ABW6KAH4_9BACI